MYERDVGRIVGWRSRGKRVAIHQPRKQSGELAAQILASD
jgi:hypothetical protein